MARVSARTRPERERVLVPVRQACPGCGGHMRLRYENRRNLVTLSGAVRLRLRIRRCEAPGAPASMPLTGRRRRAPWRCRSTSSAWT